MLLIGSQALKIHYPELLDRDPVDYDLVATHDEFKEFVKHVGFNQVIPQDSGSKMLCFLRGFPPVEVEIAWPETSAELLLKVDHGAERSSVMGYEVQVASFNSLFALKASHRFKKNTPFFIKTRRDYLNMLEAGAIITQDLIDFYKLREKETYSYKHPKLNVSKGQFFNGDGVTYVYDHDTIHLAMSYPLEPAYKSFQDPNDEVKVRRDLWNELDEFTKLRSVLEESYVLALERSQIPFGDRATPKESFLMALEKVCTSITSGWWRDYAYLNYDKVLAMYSDNYVDKLSNGINMGIVKPYKAKEAINVSY